MITRNQKIAVFVLTLVMALDAAISINGAWNHNATFYEANPIFAMFGNVERFAVAVIALKAIAIGITAYVVSVLNRDLGESWGDALASGATFCFAGLVVTMGVINVMV